MTAVDTPTFIQAGGESAEETRRSLGAMFGLRGGIVGSGDLAVTQNSPTGMSVIVAGGQVVIPGDETTYQGYYICENRGNQVVSIAPSDPTNGRLDLIVARVRDSQYSGGADTFTLEAVTGTAAGVPATPTAPANCWVLARISVATATSAIVNANIQDFRTGGSGFTDQNGRASALGAAITCTSTLRPVSPFAGMIIYETDTGNLMVYTGSTWREVYKHDAWTDYNSIAVTQGVSVSRTVSYSRYTKEGRNVTFEWDVVASSSGTSGQGVSISLPFTSVRANTLAGRFSWYDTSAAVFYQTDALLGSTTTVNGLVQAGPGSGATIGINFGGAVGGVTYPTQVATGDTLRGFVVYEASS